MLSHLCYHSNEDAQEANAIVVEMKKADWEETQQQQK